MKLSLQIEPQDLKQTKIYNYSMRDFPRLVPALPLPCWGFYLSSSNLSSQQRPEAQRVGGGHENAKFRSCSFFLILNGWKKISFLEEFIDWCKWVSNWGSCILNGQTYWLGPPENDQLFGFFLESGAGTLKMTWGGKGSSFLLADRPRVGERNLGMILIMPQTPQIQTSKNPQI